MSKFNYYKIIKGVAFAIIACCLVTFNYQASGQTVTPCGYANGTLNLPSAPQNLQVLKSYKKTSELFFTLPDSQSIEDYNSYDIMHLEPVKRIERLVYAKDSSGQEVVLKHVLDPSVQFKPAIEPYELMVLYPTSVEIFNRQGIVLYSSELDSLSYDNEGGNGEHGGGSGIDTSSVSITYLEGDSVYRINGPNFIMFVDKPKGLFIETVYDDQQNWELKEITFYDPLNEDRLTPVLEINITRDTLPISGECIFRVISTAYEEYCMVDTMSSIRKVKEFYPVENLTMTKWPNPAYSSLNVFIESENVNDLVQIELVNLEGKALFSTSTQVNQKFSIDVSSFVPGLYLLVVRSTSESIVERIIIQN